MKTWDTVAIVGVGLLGGSIGLALQQRRLAQHVVGIGRRASSLRTARSYHTVHATTTELSEGVAGAELIIVCTPVESIVEHVCLIADHCPPGAVITDVGSTKADIVTRLNQRLDPGVQFVGSHPMAGSEKTGAEHAVADLFEQRVSVVTPVGSRHAAAVDSVVALWESLGSRVVRMAPEAHDQAVSMTSHATHLIAAALAASTSRDDLLLAAGGWQDTTRIAAADPGLWEQILLMNRDQVLQSLGKFEKVLTQFRNALQRGDREHLKQLLEAGKEIRDSLGN